MIHTTDLEGKTLVRTEDLQRLIRERNALQRRCDRLVTENWIESDYLTAVDDERIARLAAEQERDALQARIGAARAAALNYIESIEEFAALMVRESEFGEAFNAALLATQRKDELLSILRPTTEGGG